MKGTNPLPPQVPRPRPNPSLAACTIVLSILGPLPLLLFGGDVGVPFYIQSWIVVAMSASVTGLGVAALFLVWRSRLPEAILATTLYGVFAGAECAAAAFLIPYGGFLLPALAFGLPVSPAVLATYLLLREWLRNLARATSAAPWAVRRTARKLAAVYAGYAALEGLGFLWLFLRYTAPCAGASGSQTSCSSPRELAALIAMGLGFVVPIFVTVTLGGLLEHERNALIRSGGPPPPGH